MNFFRFLLVFVFCLISIYQIFAVDENIFIKCKDSGFCRRNRALKNVDEASLKGFYTVLSETCTSTQNGFECDISDKKRADLRENLYIQVTILENLTTRMTIRDHRQVPRRFELNDFILPLQKKTLASSEIIKHADSLEISSSSTSPQQTTHFRLQMFFDPFTIAISLNGKVSFIVNEQHLFNMERGPAPDAGDSGAKSPLFSGETPSAASDAAETPADTPAENAAKTPDELSAELAANLGPETFKHFTDSKPKGPTSVGLDFSFVDTLHLYGIPEHAASFDLAHTLGPKAPAGGGEPYRLFNLDVFEYDLEKLMALYASVPFMMGKTEGGDFMGLLWLNAAETWIDIYDSSFSAQKSASVLAKVGAFIKSIASNSQPPQNNSLPSTQTHWFSESGILDFFFFPGPSPYHVFQQYAHVTGTTPLPPLPTIGYHQCRWNYNDMEDVRSLHRNFDRYDIPVDFIWLDIEHTDGKRYFTWDPVKFADPVRMQEEVAAKGRFMVTIIDPHIKRDEGYYIHAEAQANRYYVLNKDGQDFQGNCWPGSSSYLDFLNPRVRNWWADKFAFDQYKGSTPHLFTWNDMNEPSVFDGPEVSMHRDNIHHEGWEHRDVHNIYGMLLPMSTMEGQLRRSGYRDRAFVLSRSGFAGSQKFGAIWTGDNRAEWGHLKMSIPMLLSFSVAGVSFIGADVGGFFGNPDSELLLRWYQTGAFQPFFRAHAHIDTKRREPWLFDPEYTTLIREAVRKRYEILPYLYTLFFTASQKGFPVMRPLWAEFPTDPISASIQTEFLLGSALLVAPVLEAGASVHAFYLPGHGDIWYCMHHHVRYHSGHHSISVSLSSIPVFQRGATIIAKKLRVRRASSLFAKDPYTLFVALSANGTFASGELYADDGKTLAYQSGDFSLVQFVYSQNVLRSALSSGSSAVGKFECEINGIVILGYQKTPAKIVSVAEGKIIPLTFQYYPNLQKLIIKKPLVYSSRLWEVRIE